MATVQQDNIVVRYKPAVPYNVKTDGTADVNGGDNVWFDSTGPVVKSLDSDTHATHYVGIADNGSYIQPYNTKQYASGQIPVCMAGLARMGSVGGDTITDNNALYYSTDAQTVTNTAASHIIGYSKMRAGVTTVSGASGTTIDMIIATQDPTSAFA